MRKLVILIIITLILLFFSIIYIFFYDGRNVINNRIPKEVLYCEIDEDCVIKDVHNCCGYYPRCVNKDYTPDIEKVIEECKESGVASACGWPEITNCKCINNNCVSMQGNTPV